MMSEFYASTPSGASLFLEIYFGSVLLATGTAFLFEHDDQVFLITNRHNATGRDQKTGAALSAHGGVPDKVTAYLRSKQGINWEHPVTFPLYDVEGRPQWLEHPTFGSSVDVIAFPLIVREEYLLLAYSLLLHSRNILITPSEAVSVVGYPFGMRSGNVFAVWVTGFVATEPRVNHDEYPTMLIDCRTRKGMSGSPVIAHRSGGAVATEDGNTRFYSGPVTRLLGVYSGRINDQSDLGMVWKTECIVDICSQVARSQTASAEKSRSEPAGR